MLNWLVFLVCNNIQKNITIFSLNKWASRSICIRNPLMSYCTIITDVTRSVKIWHAPYARGEMMVWYLKRDSRFWQPGVQVWGNDGWSRPLFLKSLFLVDIKYVHDISRWMALLCVVLLWLCCQISQVASLLLGQSYDCPNAIEDTWAPSQYKDRLIYVWRFPC